MPERDFEADRELAALVADLLEELDELRARPGHAGLLQRERLFEVRA